MLIRGLILLVAAGACWFIASQVLVPAWRGRDLFPLFDTSKRRAKAALKEAQDLEAETKLRTETERIRVRVEVARIESDDDTHRQYDELIERLDEK